MRKIPSLFKRDWSRSVPALSDIQPGCGWVLDDTIPTVPTLKYDGTCCLVWRGQLYRRRTLEPGDTAPTNFVSDQQLRGLSKLVETPSIHGWVPIDPGSPQDQYHVQALQNLRSSSSLPEGTYELVGPKLQNNPHQLDRHSLWRHGGEIATSFAVPSLNFAGIKARLQGLNAEGVVFYELQGERLAKIKRSDFGLEWPLSA